ncbi:MAG: FtsQ-type POTRA domain-containing protein [Prolixibacteraceae bacterium]|nr:FtsQ-type POTRA domain-containing protein [Prolixibacteraceae bacterium]
MKRKQVYHITGLILLTAFIVASLSFSSHEMKNIHCNSIEINVKSGEQFVTPAEIEKTLMSQVKGITGCLMDTLNTETIEWKLAGNPWVKKAEVFKGMQKTDKGMFSGILKVSVIQREPLMKIMKGADVYYIDNEGVKLPVSYSATKHVVVVSGSVNENILKNELIEFVSYINKDKFWKAQILQIHIVNGNEVLLVPRIGRQIIEFGEIDGYESKFRNLMALYKQYLNETGWDKYTKISLKYNNQIVCTK